MLVPARLLLCGVAFARAIGEFALQPAGKPTVLRRRGTAIDRRPRTGIGVVTAPGARRPRRLGSLTPPDNAAAARTMAP
jgi:hypothetical protein